MRFSRWDRVRRCAPPVVGLLVASIAVCTLLAPSAGAKVIYDRVIHQKLGILPSPAALASANSRAAASGPPTCDQTFEPACASLMTNTGPGPVQHGERDYLFFWGPSGSYPTGYVSDMSTFLSGLAAGDYSTDNTASGVGNPLSVVQQYHDNSGPGGANNFIPLAIQNGGVIKDTHTYPSSGCTDSGFSSETHCLTLSQLQSELVSYITAHNLPTGINVEYFILTAPNVGSCDDGTNTSCFINQYCAWHTFTPVGSGRVTFANMPYLAGTGCDISTFGANSNLYTSGIDSVVGTFSHELAETMTDPLLNAWQGSGGGSDEIGDKCSYQYLVGSPHTLDFTGLNSMTSGGNEFYNATLGGHNYLMQMEFDNSANSGAGGCNQWDTQSQPTASISGPTSVVTGSSAAFSANVSTPAGSLAYIDWNFGDGSAVVRTTGTSTSHSYGVAAGRTVTAIVTDTHGNEVKTTKNVTVTSGGGGASLALSVIPNHPAPKGAYTVSLHGNALSGGTFGSGHNRSDMELYEQFGATCPTTWAGERSRAAAGKATDIGHSLVAAGSFGFTQHRVATPTPHATVRFCGYVSRAPSVTDAKATGFYTTT